MSNDKLRIKELWEQGFGIEEIIDMTGYKESSIRSALFQVGYSVKQIPKDPAWRAEFAVKWNAACEQFWAGMKYRENR